MPNFEGILVFDTHFTTTGEVCIQLVVFWHMCAMMLDLYIFYHVGCVLKIFNVAVIYVQ